MSSLSSTLRTLARRALVVGALSAATFGLGATLVPREAHASVSIAIRYETLLKDADVVAVMTSSETKSVWEDGRIYTYTKVKVDQGVAGDVSAGAEGWVRTMGGVVGKIGQLVDGEPVFTEGKSSLLFLRKFKGNDVFEVSARAQGQYPIMVDDKKVQRVMRSGHVGMLLPPKDTAAPLVSQVQTQSLDAPKAAIDAKDVKLAYVFLHDRPLDDVVRDVGTAWRSLHPKTSGQ